MNENFDVVNGFQLIADWKNMSAGERNFCVPNLINLAAPKSPEDEIFQNGISVLWIISQQWRKKEKNLMKHQKLGLLMHFSWDKFKHHCMKSVPDKCFQALL